MNKLFIIAVPFILFIIYTIFIWAPVAFYTEAECLRDGYPEYRVSINLERYCVVNHGAIMVKAGKQ